LYVLFAFKVLNSKINELNEHIEMCFCLLSTNLIAVSSLANRNTKSAFSCGSIFEIIAMVLSARHFRFVRNKIRI